MRRWKAEPSTLASVHGRRRGRGASGAGSSCRRRGNHDGNRPWRGFVTFFELSKRWPRQLRTLLTVPRSCLSR